MKKDKKLNVIIAVLAVALVAVVGITAFFLTRSKSETKSPDTSSSVVAEDNSDISDTDKTDTEDTDTELISFDERKTTYPDGDYTYRSSSKNLDYDVNEQVFFFNNVIIVYSLSDLSDEKINEIKNSINGELAGHISNNTLSVLQFKVKESSFAEIQEMTETVKKIDGVFYASYDFLLEAEESKSNDPWSIDSNNPNRAVNEQNKEIVSDWWVEAIGAYSAWDTATKLSPITVGVIDGGFDTDHDELNGKISFPEGMEQNSEDDHGTHVAGLIAARANNGTGLRGVASHADLLCVDWIPVTNDHESQDYVAYSILDFLKSYLTMLDKNEKIINCSFGCITLPSGTQYLKDNKLIKHLFNAKAIKNQYEEYIASAKNESVLVGKINTVAIICGLLQDKDDFIFVQAAGNGYDNGGEGYDALYSGSFASINQSVFNELINGLSDDIKENIANKEITYEKIKEHIVVVGATDNRKDENDNYYMRGSSNYGETVDICAPGQDIFSCATNNTYAVFSGTSMATPIVSGSLALIWSYNPELSAKEVKDYLMKGCTKKALGVGNGSAYSYPFLNIGNSISMVQEDMAPNNQKERILYKEFLYAEHSDDLYLLHDIDGDDSIELIVYYEGDSMAETLYYVYTVNNGVVEKVGEVSARATEIITDGKDIFTFDYSQGGVYLNKLSIENGELKTTTELSKLFDDEDELNKQVDEIYQSRGCLSCLPTEYFYSISNPLTKSEPTEQDLTELWKNAYKVTQTYASETGTRNQNYFTSYKKSMDFKTTKELRDYLSEYITESSYDSFVNKWYTEKDSGLYCYCPDGDTGMVSVDLSSANVKILSKSENKITATVSYNTTEFGDEEYQTTSYTCTFIYSDGFWIIDDDSKVLSANIFTE